MVGVRVMVEVRVGWLCRQCNQLLTQLLFLSVLSILL